jgi:Tfp pilus assembly protein PilP
MSELMRSATTIIVGFLLAAAAPGLSAQTNPSATKQMVQNAVGGGAKQAAPQAAKPAPKPAQKAATTKAPKKPAAPTRATGADQKPAEGADTAKVARRDPFESLIARQQAAANAGKNLPPGKAGLQVSTLRVDGIVKSNGGMIAVVTNPQSRTYFLREGDRLYDGAVDKISMDGVTFHEEGKDAFGKPIERQVNKRIYSIAGEGQ